MNFVHGLRELRDKWDEIRHKEMPRLVILLIGAVCTASFVYFAWF